MGSDAQKDAKRYSSYHHKLSFSIHSELDRFKQISTQRNLGNDHNDYGALERLWSQVAIRNSGRVISAVDATGKDTAACVLVWDQKTVYYLLSARSDDPGGRKANNALIFESLKFARELQRDFDADGYATIESGQFLSKLGLPMSLRATVEKRGAAYGVLKPIKDLLSLSRPPL
jgi:hypothetical protein